MRRRLLIVYLTLLVTVLLGLDVSLAVTLTARINQAAFIDRLNDTERFASLAEPALRTGRLAALEAEFRQYDEVYGIAVAVVTRTGRPVLASRDRIAFTSPAVRERVTAALHGQHANAQPAVWPGQSTALVVAVPVGRGGEVIGAVLTVSPTDALRTAIAWQLVLLAGVSAGVLAVGAVAATPLTRWMLRPVRQLDTAAAELADGRHRLVASTAGPPELRRLATSFNQMAVRITTLLERQRSFVSYASHQLRTPLATMRLSAENLAPAVEPEGSEDLQLLTEEIDRLGRLCDALLRYARAESTAECAEVVDAFAVTRYRLDVWRPLAGQAGVRLELTGESPALVRVALQALDQALDALLSNAVKFVGGGATVSVRVVPTGDGWVGIHIADNGPGVPDAELGRLTQAFWRGAATQRLEGSGLGLTIAEALIVASGGELGITAATPHGLRATIRLRQVGAATHHEPGARAAVGASETPAGAGRQRTGGVRRGPVDG